LGDLILKQKAQKMKALTNDQLKARAQQMVADLYAKGTDLHLGGILGGYASTGSSTTDPDGVQVCAGSYKQGDKHVRLKDGRDMHVSPTKRGDFMVLLAPHDEPEKVSRLWFSPQAIKDAIKQGWLLAGKQIIWVDNMRPLQRLLARVSV
jgi:hypothetical protein